MMLGARTGAWAKSGGVPTARDYVQDGLIAMWDGIENAGWGVHDPNATVWKDLFGGFDLTVNRNAFFSQYGLCSYDNSSVTKGIAYRDETIPQDKVKTIEICARVDASNKYQPYYAWVLVLNDELPLYSTNLCVILRNSPSEGMMRTAISSSPVSRDYLPHHYVVTKDIGFLDGKELSSIEYNNTFINQQCFCLFGRNGSTYYQPGAGMIYRCAIHSRALTADEIAANYAIDKARFNLP